MLVEHAVQPPCLVDIAIHAVLNPLRGVAHKVIGLALHRAQAGVLEEEPVGHLVVFTRARGKADTVVTVVLLDQILEDAAGLEDADRLAVGEGVGDGRDAPVRVDLEEPRLLLSVGRDVDVLNLVGQAELLERHRDLDPVGCGVRVESDVGPFGFRHGG